MARRQSLRSQLSRAARDLGNVQAARGGPMSNGKRVVRRKVYQTTNVIKRRMLKDLDLSCRQVRGNGLDIVLVIGTCAFV